MWFNNIKKSSWYEDAVFRENNNYWIKHSNRIAVKILRYLRENNITKEELSHNTQIPLETLNKMVKGKYNYSIEEIGRIEKITNCNILN